MKRTFLSGLIGTPGHRGNLFATLFSLFFFICSICLLTGFGGAQSTLGGITIGVISASALVALVYNAWKDSK